MGTVRPCDFGAFLSQVPGFLGRFHAPPRELDGAPLDGAFSNREGAAPDLYGAADAAYALWILGELSERTDAASRQVWVERIRGHQNPETGWFDRSILAGHGAPHATAFATGALALLGAESAHPLRYAEALFGSRARIERWLEGFGWQQIWTGSHAAGAAAALIDAPRGVALGDGWLGAVLDAFEARIDPATGFWKRAWHDRLWRRPTPLDLGGAAHFWWLFERGGRPLPHADRVLDGILGLQRSDGLWGSRWFGGAYPHGLDFDALHGLRRAWLDATPAAREPRRARLAECLVRYADAAHAFLTPSGAVARWFRTPHKLVGTLDALAELERAARVVLGSSLVTTPRPLRSALERVSWQ